MTLDVAPERLFGLPVDDRPRLVDDPARDAIASDLRTTFFVEAGAGSGKTTALVRRIVALVASASAPLQQIAAITFTEAAAAELRVRIREGLEDRLTDSSGDVALRCERALGRIDEAPISTIHGFCQRLLTSHPIEAGLPPRIEVLDEISEGVEWSRRWAAQLDEMAGDPEVVELVSLAWALDVTARRLQLLARAIDRNWHECAESPPDLADVLTRADNYAAGRLASLTGAIEAAVAERASCLDHSDALARWLATVEHVPAELRAAPDWRSTLPLVASLKVPKRLGRKENWADVDACRSLLEAVEDARGQLLHGLFDIAVRALAQSFEFAARRAAADRRRRGRLTFQDLLVFARDLLRDSPVVRNDVRTRYPYILIDEFQDTDPLQLEIASLIGQVPVGEVERAGVGVGATGEWEDGRCFFVGDPKQSIYRFRGADLDAYEAAKKDIVGTRATLLTSNFRSAPGVIDFVNGCFADLLGARFERLDAARPTEELVTYRAGHGAVSIVGGEIEKRTLRPEQRRIESEDLARVIDRLVAERWEAFDVSTGRLRAARLGDVAILVPRRTGLREIEAALDEHGIGYRVESASLIFKSQEVRDVLALARAIDEPGNHAAVVATLRSPAYSIGDDELAAWSLAGGRWSIEAQAPETAVAAAPTVGSALADLASLRAGLRRLGPAGTLAEAVRRRRLLQVMADRPRARESWRRVRYIVDRARAFVEGGGRSLTEFADWVDEQVEGGLRTAESVVPDADEDVVRILTVHGAKGLEFPITILCGFGTTDGNRDYETILRRPGGPTEVRFTRDLQTSEHAVLDSEERRQDDAEAVRLLYVAATRARDHLVVCGHHVAGTSPYNTTLAERLLEAVAGLAVPPVRLESVLDNAGDEAIGTAPAAALSAETAPVAGEAAEAAEAAEESTGTAVAGPPPLASLGIASVGDYEEWGRLRRERIAAATHRSSLPATEIARVVAEVTGASPPVGWRGRGRAGTEIGRAVHATLQSVSQIDAIGLAAGSNDTTSDHQADVVDGGSEPAVTRLRSIAEVQAGAERVSPHAGEVTRLAYAALTSPSVRQAFASGHARRETYVSTTVGGTVVDGFVDLCFVDGDGELVVIDYKTDSVRDRAEAAERATAHELQVAAYGVALADATGRRVKRCVLVFLSPQAEPIEHELAGDALAARTATVRDAVARMYE